MGLGNSGALADGKTLRLTIQERPAAPAKPMGMNLKGTKTRQENQRNAAGPRSNGAPLTKQQNLRQAEEKPVQDVQMDLPASHPERYVDWLYFALYEHRTNFFQTVNCVRIALQLTILELRW